MQLGVSVVASRSVRHYSSSQGMQYLKSVENHWFIPLILKNKRKEDLTVTLN